MVWVLGASVTLLGAIEGIAEATTSVTKVFSGAISDWFGRRKLLAVLGYGIGTLTNPVSALATTPIEVLAARFVDRIGKEIRGAPREALVADIAPASMRGAAYGLRQAPGWSNQSPGGILTHCGRTPFTAHCVCAPVGVTVAAASTTEHEAASRKSTRMIYATASAKDPQSAVLCHLEYSHCEAPATRRRSAATLPRTASGWPPTRLRYFN